jgi:hypothetical protein
MLDESVSCRQFAYRLRFASLPSDLVERVSMICAVCDELPPRPRLVDNTGRPSMRPMTTTSGVPSISLPPTTAFSAGRKKKKGLHRCPTTPMPRRPYSTPFPAFPKTHRPRLVHIGSVYAGDSPQGSFTQTSCPADHNIHGCAAISGRCEPAQAGADATIAAASALLEDPAGHAMSCERTA